MINDPFSNWWISMRCRSDGAAPIFGSRNYKDLAPTEHLFRLVKLKSATPIAFNCSPQRPLPPTAYCCWLRPKLICKPSVDPSGAMTRTQNAFLPLLLSICCATNYGTLRSPRLLPTSGPTLALTTTPKNSNQTFVPLYSMLPLSAPRAKLQTQG